MNHTEKLKQLAANRPDHADFSPSSGHRWSKCLGHWEATKDLPSMPAGKAAERGTIAHNLLESCLLKSLLPEDLSNDAEINDWVGYCLDYVEQYIALHPLAEVFPEAYLPWYGVSGGTTDLLGISPEEILIADLKTGSVPVHPANNIQLLIYAIAAREHFGYREYYRGVIIQPPTAWLEEGPVREVLWTNTDLDQWEETLIYAIKKNLEGAERTPGGHCKWCKAEAICPPRADYSLNRIGLSLKNDFLEDP